jgi:hypothetical protein
MLSKRCYPLKTRKTHNVYRCFHRGSSAIGLLVVCPNTISKIRNKQQISRRFRDHRNDLPATRSWDSGLVKCIIASCEAKSPIMMSAFRSTNHFIIALSQYTRRVQKPTLKLSSTKRSHFEIQSSLRNRGARSRGLGDCWESHRLQDTPAGTPRPALRHRGEQLDTPRLRRNRTRTPSCCNPQHTRKDRLPARRGRRTATNSIAHRNARAPRANRP